jgi:NADPH-dependent ferric siderophore reductase
MTAEDDRRALAGIRREPPRFRVVSVRTVRTLTPRMVRVTFGGEQLAGLEVDQPAASIRLLLPSPGAGLVIPTWSGNEFLLDDGSRPIIRTFTPLNLDPDRLEIDLDIVRHDGGAASSWAEAAQPGDRAAISGPGRGYEVDAGATAFLLAGDEAALPAIGQLIEAIPPSIPVQVIVEIVQRDAQRNFASHPALVAEWVERSSGDAPGASLVSAIEDADIPEGAKVWVAGEAAAMHRVRRHLFEYRGVPRSDVTVRGYWKHGR